MSANDEEEGKIISEEEKDSLSTLSGPATSLALAL